METPAYIADIVHDNVHFIMPRDRELQFCAMAVLQRYVQTYDAKMAYNTPDKNKLFRIMYSVDMPDADWQMFIDMGFKVAYKPQLQPITHPDMVVDLTDERINRFSHSGKHATQACGVMAGAETRSYPELKQIKPRDTKPAHWLVFDDDLWPFGLYPDPIGISFVPGADLRTAWDGLYTGVIGYASWHTYLAVSVGLPVIEVLPEGRHRNWMSKFFSPYYRMVEGDDKHRQIAAAMRNIEELLCTQAAVIRDPEE
jgi:hypothetical protein